MKSGLEIVDMKIVDYFDKSSTDKTNVVKIRCKKIPLELLEIVHLCLTFDDGNDSQQKALMIDSILITHA